MKSAAAGWTWRVFAICWLVYTAFWTPYLLREHFPAFTLSESGTLNVEGYLGWSNDIFRGARGGAYINNNPGASLTAAVPLVVLRPVLRRVEEWNRTLPRTGPPLNDPELVGRMVAEGRGFYFLLAAFLCVALVMAPATAGVAAYLCSRLAASGVAPVHAAQAALIYGIGTPVLFRAEHLNHNLLVCNAGFAALLLLWDPRNSPLTAFRAAGAGLLAGYTVLCDYSGVVVVAVTSLYVWMRSADGRPAERWKTLAAYAAGAAPALVGLILYQAWAFGSFYRPSQHYMAPTAPTVHGYRGMDWPSPSLLWANFFDARFGLFAYCPALLLAFGAPFVKRVRHRVPPRETAVLLIYFLLFVLFCAANQYSWLQPLTGFRYLVPVVPALALLALQTAEALPRGVRRLLATATCVQSILMVAGYQNNFPRAVQSLWERQFQLPWMLRLGKLGISLSPAFPAIFFLLLALAVTAIWRLRVGRGRPGNPNNSENTSFFGAGTGAGA
jgi:hypothetical protein